jgi:hypothetical protein
MTERDMDSACGSVKEGVEAILDRLCDDEAVWNRLVTTVQFELFKSTAGNTNWQCPDDIADDVICAVVGALGEVGALATRHVADGGAVHNESRVR